MIEDDSGDEDFDSRQELLFVEEEDWAPSGKTVETRSKRAPTVNTEILIEDNGKIRRKAEDKDEPKKRQKCDPKLNLTKCSHCDASFTRKDNLNRHIRNKH
jgi:hypothetical protein